MNIRTLSTVLMAAMVTQAQANIDIQFDYSLDTSGFFAQPERRAVLEAAAATFEVFSDSLSAITSTGTNANSFDVNFFDPANPGSAITIENFSVGANVIRVYVGGFNFAGNSLGQGGPGGFSCSGFGAFCSAGPARGQGTVRGDGATDVAPWGGALSFDVDTNWHNGVSSAGLGASQIDLYSVATHELAHLLGFGTSASFANLSAGGQFNGSGSGLVPLSADGGHWQEGTVSMVNGTAQEAAMDPTITAGTRKYFTALDYAAMQDIGWQVSPVPEASTWALMAMGLGAIGLRGAARHRFKRAA